MASSDLSLKSNGGYKVDTTVSSEIYTGFNLSLLDNLCMEVILRQNYQHKKVEMVYDSYRPPLRLCGRANLRILPPPLFENLSPDYKPLGNPKDIPKKRNYL